MGKTLYKTYRQEIEQWDWEAIKADALENVEADFDGNREGWSFLGTVFALCPSGKYYQPFACSNVSAREAHRDEEWYQALDDIAESYGMYIQSGEGDPCDLFACVSVEEGAEEEDMLMNTVAERIYPLEEVQE